MDEDSHFYEQLVPFVAFEDVASPSVYTRVPDSWWVLITDVKGSTKAIEAGRYKDVNALGVSTITAVLNAIPGVQFPYVFGGDGATLVVPGSKVELARVAAAAAMTLAQQAFGLELRAGLVPVSEITQANHEVRVARFKASTYINLAMFEGGGLAYAEKLVKDPVEGARYAVTPAEHPDWNLFQGFECRWRPIPARKDHILSLLVVARSGTADQQRDVYRRVVKAIHHKAHLGEEALRPVSAAGLHLEKRTAAYDVEARVRTGRSSGLRYLWWLLQTKVLVYFADLFIRRKWAGASPVGLGRFDGATYRQDVAANTDFRKFDDTLRMVIDVSVKEQQAIETYLESERLNGTVAYGLHTSPAALMTCLINDFGGNHVHFVDGSHGGYALAAKQLKEQLKQPTGA